MIAAQDEGVARAFEHGGHAASIGFDARRPRIVESPSVNGTPEVGVQLEVGAAPLVAHRLEDSLEVRLSFGMRAIQRIPGSPAPAAEGDAIGTKRLCPHRL